MPVRVVCPHCKQALRLPEALYHRPAMCPGCSGAFEVRWRQAAGSGAVLDVLPASAEEEAQRRPCPHCGRPIRSEAAKCPFCRSWLEVTKNPGGDQVAPPGKELEL